ncbi:subunit CCDC53 of endosome WASH complex [Nitzschia inconspicua]|uniref:Subunit CCDC53 of endosome WASH complex n=1 Tax=Nitzschia inconspicua TaxID=303405 RepID=A0A9K3Q816_9STRA|nr:subunit CCDC53 of endosome WASH complex [Nitzschia inconspicua]
MDVQAQLAKAVQARFRQMNGIEEPTPPPSTMRPKVKEPLSIPKADPGAKNAAAAALAAKFGNLGGPAKQKISRVPQGGVDDEAVAAKYRKMMKVGMPEAAVHHKMVADGIANHIIESVMKGDAPAPKSNVGSPSSGGGFHRRRVRLCHSIAKWSK